MRSVQLLAAFLLLPLIYAVAVAAEPDWSDPSTVDIYDPASAAFLDTDIQALFDAAKAAYDESEYETAAQYYLACLRFDARDTDYLYNLAACVSLLSEAELAAHYVELAVDGGFKDMWWLGEDPDFDGVREDPVFAETIERLTDEIEEKQAGLGNIVYFEAPIKLRARVWFPPEYDPSKRYTLLIGLHGFGSYPDRFVNLRKRLEGEEFIYLSPQGPYPFISGLDDVGYSWGDWIEGEGLPRGSWDLSRDYVRKLIEEASTMYNAEKVYLLGFSQGAAMTIDAGIHNHGLVDGLIAFGGWLDTNRLSDADLQLAAETLRVVIVHGNEDYIVEFQSALDAVEKLEAAGFDYLLHEFDGGHAVPEEALRAAWEWLETEPSEEMVEETE